MIEASLADGRVLEFPDGTDPNIIQATVKKMIGGQAPPQPTPQPATAQQSPQQAEGGFGSFIEPMATLASSIVAEPIAGVAGIAQSLNPWADEGAGAEAVQSTREALTYMPKTELGKQTIAEVGGALQPTGEALQGLEKGLGDFAFDLTGSPALSAAAASTPTALFEILGLASLKSLRTGERLLDLNGKPTKLLRKELDKQGLDFDSLHPEAQKLIPEYVAPDLMPRKRPVSRDLEASLIEQIQQGGKQDALATLKVEGGKVRPDKLGAETVKQGFRPGFVQSVKTSSKATKAKMQQMVRSMRKVKGSERSALDARPSDIVGDSVTERLGYIVDNANSASKELNEIARNKLSGLDIDSVSVLDKLAEHLDDLDIKTVKTPSGIPKPVFEGSLISKDRSSQRVIRDLFALLSEGGKPDALRAHKLKRQLDIMIDFNKKSAMGLSDAGKKVLKSVRHELNQSLRAVDDDYARVNDVLSLSLGTINDLDKAVGSMDIMGKGANKALGQRMRALMSNQQGRVKIENALDQINEAAKQLGGTFDDDIKTLAMFADGLDDRFGAVAKTSFSGQIEQAVGNAATRNPKSTIVEAVGRAAGKGVEKLRGVNDFNAFEALDALLK